MQCNIDAKGRAVRLISGLFSAGIGVVLTLLAVFDVIGHMPWLWVGIALLVTGGFQIYEGWAGWCVLRAMGIRTKL